MKTVLLKMIKYLGAGIFTFATGTMLCWYYFNDTLYVLNIRQELVGAWLLMLCFALCAFYFKDRRPGLKQLIGLLAALGLFFHFIGATYYFLKDLDSFLSALKSYHGVPIEQYFDFDWTFRRTLSIYKLLYWKITSAFVLFVIIVWALTKNKK